MESTSLNEAELLRDELKLVLFEYNISRSEEKRQNLLQLLQNNNCREIIVNDTKSVILSQAFVHAAGRNHVDILQAFLCHNINIDINELDTALIRASKYNQKESVELLLNRNANPDLQDIYGKTALMYATRNRQKEIVQLLLNYNADTELIDNRGRTVLNLGLTEEIKEMLQNHLTSSYVLK